MEPELTGKIILAVLSGVVLTPLGFYLKGVVGRRERERMLDKAHRHAAAHTLTEHCGAEAKEGYIEKLQQEKDEVGLQ